MFYRAVESVFATGCRLGRHTRVAACRNNERRSSSVRGQGRTVQHLSHSVSFVSSQWDANHQTGAVWWWWGYVTATCSSRHLATPPLPVNTSRTSSTNTQRTLKIASQTRSPLYLTPPAFIGIAITVTEIPVTTMPLISASARHHRFHMPPDARHHRILPVTHAHATFRYVTVAINNNAFTSSTSTLCWSDTFLVAGNVGQEM